MNQAGPWVGDGQLGRSTTRRSTTEVATTSIAAATAIATMATTVVAATTTITIMTCVKVVGVETTRVLTCGCFMEGSGILVLGTVGSLCLLKKKERAGSDEAGEGGLHGDDGGNVVVVLVKTSQSSQNEGFVRDDFTDVGEGVGKNLQLVAILRHCHVSLREAVELSMEMKGTILSIFVEEIFNVLPYDVGSGIGDHDDIENLRGNRSIKPGEHDESC